jgi:hypothetical protein
VIPLQKEKFKENFKLQENQAEEEKYLKVEKKKMEQILMQKSEDRIRVLNNSDLGSPGLPSVSMGYCSPQVHQFNLQQSMFQQMIP